MVAAVAAVEVRTKGVVRAAMVRAVAVRAVTLGDVAASGGFWHLQYIY